MKPTHVFWLDENRRVYTKPESGRLFGSLIVREQWRKLDIVGETSRSFITSNGRKIPKNGPLPHGYLRTESDVEDWCWMREHRHRIADAIHRINDARMLRSIADLIGYGA